VTRADVQELLGHCKFVTGIELGSSPFYKPGCTMLVHFDGHAIAAQRSLESVLFHLVSAVEQEARRLMAMPKPPPSLSRPAPVVVSQIVERCLLHEGKALVEAMHAAARRGPVVDFHLGCAHCLRDWVFPLGDRN
jgi:hypothetical protein